MYPCISIGGIIVDAWNLCLALSYVLCTVSAVLLRPKDFGLDRVKVFWASTVFFIAGLFGATFLNILINYRQYQGASLEHIFNSAGMAYMGAPVLGFLSLWVFSKETRTSFMANADYLIQFCMLERVIGRLGCLLAGCCYGISSNLPWAIIIDEATVSIHPTQAYELIAAFSIFCTMLVCYKKLKEYRGASFFMVAALYSGTRFLNEFLRAEGPFIAGFLKHSHVLLFLIFCISIIRLYFLAKKSPDFRKSLINTLLIFLAFLLVNAVVFLAVLSIIVRVF